MDVLYHRSDLLDRDTRILTNQTLTELLVDFYLKTFRQSFNGVTPRSSID